MSALLLGFIAAILGIIPILLKKDRKGVSVLAILLLVVYTALGWLIFYNALPSLAYPVFGGVGLMALIFSGISFGIGVGSDEDFNFGIIVPGFVLVAFIFSGIRGCEMGNSDKYSSLIGDLKNKNMTHWSKEIQPLDPKHIRLVPKELAITVAKTTLSVDGSTLGSQFPLTESYTTLQMIKGDYFYLIPLDFAGFSVWTSTDYVPGFVKISATDPYEKPELITTNKLKYTPDAWFGDNMYRILWNKYYNKILTDYSFEQDDNGNVYWVITVCKPTISFWGDKVEGVILFNPYDGTDKYLTVDEVNNNSEYKWIDRIYPEDLIQDYAKYWGSLKDGWWNSAWKGLNLLQPETPTMNYSIDGECMIVQPITSTSEQDQAMTGLIYTSARTGQSTYYTISSGATEESIIEVVNNAVSYKKWHASEQIVYENIYGKMSAIVPILSETGKNYMGVAIVENENKRVAIGATPQEALFEYKKMLSAIGGQITTDSKLDTKILKAIIVRIGWDVTTTGKLCYMTLDKNKNHSYLITSDTQSELALSNPGDSIIVKYNDTTENPITVFSFKNLTLNLAKSDNQSYIDSSMTTKKEVKELKTDVKDFKEKVKDMSDEDVQKLLKNK